MAPGSVGSAGMCDVPEHIEAEAKALHQNPCAAVRIMNRLLNTEAQHIAAGGIIPLGTSCLTACSKD